MTSHEATQPGNDLGDTTEIAQVPKLDPRISAILHRLDDLTAQLAGGYYQTAKELTNKASVLQDRLSEVIEAGHDLDGHLTDANDILGVATKTEADCQLARNNAQVRFDVVDNRKLNFLRAGKAPFEELALEPIEDKSDVDDAVQQFRSQLLTVLSLTEPAEEGEESVLHAFFADYVDAQEDLRAKVAAHEKSERELTAAQKDVAFFESAVEKFDQQASAITAQLNKSRRRHKTGVRHIKGERMHQQIMDGLGSWAIVQAMRNGGVITSADFKQLEADS
jgi:hypothetical protein